MKKSMPLFIILAMFALSLTIVPGARAALIVDTGVGTNYGYGQVVDYSNMMSYHISTVAARFTLNQGYTVSDVKGYMNGSGTLDVLIYGDSSNSINFSSLLYSASFNPVGAAGWQGVSGQSWNLAAGNYWVVFQGSSKFEGSATMPTDVTTPLLNYQVGQYSGPTPPPIGSLTWYDETAHPVGIQIQSGGGGGGAVATPEPGTMMLLGSGVLTFGLSRFRRRKREVIA